jgi:hypothetical protein
MALNALSSLVHQSRMDRAMEVLTDLWVNKFNYETILDAVVPAALSSFSHQYSSLHVPKENEYLRRILSNFSADEQLDFLKRYIEYLAWSPKYRVDSTQASATGFDNGKNPIESYLDSLEQHRGIPALHYLQKIAEDSLEEAVRTILRIGCVDVSQAIGHYYSCTESMIKLALRSKMPLARDHLFTATLYLMQSKPVRLAHSKAPKIELDEILPVLMKKTGFVAYHYMILANGLLNQKDFLGERYYQHGLASLEKILPKLSEGMTHRYLHRFIENTHRDDYDVEELKQQIWKGNKPGVFTALLKYYRAKGITSELKNAILHSYTMIDDHPHDPHYVTVPISLFELVKHLKDDDVELALAHSVEFAVNRIQERGVTSTL